MAAPQTKKADVEEHPEVFLHVGLLFNELHGAGRNSTGRVAPYLGIRRTQLKHEMAFTVVTCPRVTDPLDWIVSSKTGKARKL